MIDELAVLFAGKRILLLAPGKTLNSNYDNVKKHADGAVVIAVNFLAKEFNPDYIFSSNMRRFVKIQGKTEAKCIITSNMKEALQRDFVVNFASYVSKHPSIIDNSAVMLLKLLVAVGVKNVEVAGMDGYSEAFMVYYDSELDYDFTREAVQRNVLISDELREIHRQLKIEFVTPTVYKV